MELGENVDLKEILKKLREGEISQDEAERRLKMHYVQVNDIARFDVHRKHRTGVPEVVVAEDKTIEDSVEITREMVKQGQRVILTRVPDKHYRALKKIKGVTIKHLKDSRVCVVYKKGTRSPKRTGGKVGIITAGTSDIPVAEEARVIVEECGCKAFTAYDVGVAGLHRIIPSLKNMIKEDMDVYIVAAGREGALPTLIAGMVDSPVIGVPISSGYGMAGKGESALYTMLQSCSPLVTVNIDAGFTAGAVAVQIANKMAGARVK
jgi:NCAIR mutase (PurE)-related protein